MPTSGTSSLILGCGSGGFSTGTGAAPGLLPACIVLPAGAPVKLLPLLAGAAAAMLLTDATLARACCLIAGPPSKPVAIRVMLTSPLLMLLSITAPKMRLASGSTRS